MQQQSQHALQVWLMQPLASLLGMDVTAAMQLLAALAALTVVAAVVVELMVLVAAAAAAIAADHAQALWVYC